MITASIGSSFVSGCVDGDKRPARGNKPIALFLIEPVRLDHHQLAADHLFDLLSRDNGAGDFGDKHS
jgi:hypothetical protein